MLLTPSSSPCLAWLLLSLHPMPAAAPKPKKAATSKGAKAGKSSADAPPAPTPLESLLAAHRVAAPSALAGWKQRSDLLHLDLHLMHAPYMTVSFLLATSSPLSCLLHRLHAVHGPFSGLRLFRCSEEEEAEAEEDELTDLSVTLGELGCRGDSASDEQQEDGGMAEAVRDGSVSGGGSVSGRRRYELWYQLLSELDDALIMREPRQYVSEEQMDEAMQRDEQRNDDEAEPQLMGLSQQAPYIVVTADSSRASNSTAHGIAESGEAAQQHLAAGGVQSRATPRARLGRVVDVALDQHTSRQRVERTKGLISEAFEVSAQAGEQPHFSSHSRQQRGSRDGSVNIASPAQVEELKQQQSQASAARLLALTYS